MSSETKLIRGPLGLHFGQAIDTSEFCNGIDDAKRHHWRGLSTGLLSDSLRNMSNIFHLAMSREEFKQKIRSNSKLFSSIHPNIRNEAFYEPSVGYEGYDREVNDLEKYFSSGYSLTFFALGFSPYPVFSFNSEFQKTFEAIWGNYFIKRPYSIHIRKDSTSDKYLVSCTRENMGREYNESFIIDVIGSGTIELLNRMAFTQEVQFDFIINNEKSILVGVTIINGKLSEARKPVIKPIIGQIHEKFEVFIEKNQWKTNNDIVISFDERCMKCNIDCYCLYYRSAAHQMKLFDDMLDYHHDILEMLLSISDNEKLEDSKLRDSLVNF